MFVRSKTIGGKPYAYLVENRWEGGRARQSVSKYLGRIHQPAKGATAAAADVKDKEFRNAVELLIRNELQAHGFAEREGSLVHETITIAPAAWNITHRGKPAVLKLNEGYLCEHTIGQLLEFRPEHNDQATGYALARRLVEAGLAVPQELFVSLFEKVKPK